MRCRVGLYNKDKAYAMNLMEYFNKRKDLPFNISVFTGKYSMEESVNKGKIDMFLLDEEISLTDTAIPIIHICEDREKGYKEGYIYKYQDMREIAERIKEYAGKAVENAMAWCAVYAVFSPIGRCGKTQLAKGICQYYGKSVYVGMEEYSPECPAMQNLISNFIYYLSVNASEIIPLVEGILPDERGVRYVCGKSSYLDMRQISMDNIRWFAETFRDNGYRRIVFDVGQAALSDFNILSVFDRIIIPVPEDEVSEAKLSVFLDIIKEGGLDNIISKIKYVKAPEEGFYSQNIRECIEKEGL